MINLLASPTIINFQQLLALVGKIEINRAREDAFKPVGSELLISSRFVHFATLLPR